MWFFVTEVTVVVVMAMLMVDDKMHVHRKIIFIQEESLNLMDPIIWSRRMKKQRKRKRRRRKEEEERGGRGR